MTWIFSSDQNLAIGPSSVFYFGVGDEKTPEVHYFKSILFVFRDLYPLLDFRSLIICQFFCIKHVNGSTWCSQHVTTVILTLVIFWSDRLGYRHSRVLLVSAQDVQSESSQRHRHTDCTHIYVCYVRFNEFILCVCVCACRASACRWGRPVCRVWRRFILWRGWWPISTSTTAPASAARTATPNWGEDDANAPRMFTEEPFSSFCICSYLLEDSTEVLDII